MKFEPTLAQVARAIRQEIPFDAVEEQEIQEAARAVLDLFETVTPDTIGHGIHCDSRYTGGRCDCTAKDTVMLRLRHDLRTT